MKIFEIDRTFPKHGEKQFKSVEELLEYFKLNYLIEFEYFDSKEWKGRGATSSYYFAIIRENNHDIKYTLTTVTSDSGQVMTWKVNVTLTVGIWYNFERFPMES